MPHHYRLPTGGIEYRALLKATDALLVELTEGRPGIAIVALASGPVPLLGLPQLSSYGWAKQAGCASNSRDSNVPPDGSICEMRIIG
jgi:hypothetical protein